jgi:hypothetical protein
MDNFDHIDQLNVSISTYDINIKQIQWRTMNLWYNEIYPKYNIFARVHVHARSSRVFWSCRSIGDLNIYLPYKFEWIWTVSFARFYVQKIKRTCTRMHAFSEKNYLRSAHLQTLDYHPGRFHIDPSSSFWEHSQTRRIRIRTRAKLFAKQRVGLPSDCERDKSPD